MLPRGLLKEYSQYLAILLRIMDVAAVMIGGLLAYYCKFDSWDLTSQYQAALWAAALLTLFVFSFFHIYDSIRALSFWQHLRSLIQAVFVLFFMLAGLAFLTKTGESYSRSWFLLLGGFSFVLLILFRCIMLIALRLMRSHGWNERRVIIIGAGELGKKLLETVQQKLWTGFHVVTIFDDNAAQNISRVYGVPVIKTPENISVYLNTAGQEVDEIWLALPLCAEKRVKEILHELRNDMMTTRFVLDIFGMDLLNHSLTNLAGFPVLNIRSTPMVGVNRMVKAMEDRILAGCILLVISPLLLIIAFAVKWSSPGPVFYRQKRVGWNGKEFEMLKFRSMPINAEKTSGPVWATQNENRATRVGAFLRKTSLDELPQFINVLLGDMSIVGPRPERQYFVEQFKDEIPRYMQKHLVKAGITGWAQVNGWRGNTSLEKRIEYDLYYIENWSLTFDLKIIFLTIFRGFVNKNAY
ncbi:MAG TPA: undecaprenyl-phosphate glucose phosphotransferase [Gammaproteobacteria bacterium]|nr:undecaprenyl-phosphate glucose phosphotransferase [Gammaproteobacteria bacterium]